MLSAFDGTTLVVAGLDHIVVYYILYLKENAVFLMHQRFIIMGGA